MVERLFFTVFFCLTVQDSEVSFEKSDKTPEKDRKKGVFNAV